MHQERMQGNQDEQLATIRRAWDYYEGRHAAALVVKPGQVDDNVKINLARPIVDKSISFLFGKEVTWQIDEDAASESDAEAFLKDVWARNKKQLLLQELAQNGAMAGVAAIKVNPQPDGTFDLINLDPAELEICTDPHNIADVPKFRITYTADCDGEERNYRQEIVRVGERGSSWEIRDFEAVPGEPYRLVKTTPWPYALPPIVYCKNLPRANCTWGYGDLEDAKLNDALNLIASTIRKTLRLHAHPRTVKKGQGAVKSVDWGPDKMLLIDNADDVFNLEMQSDLGAARTFLMDLRAALYTTVRMPDVALIGDKLGQITNFGLRVLFADLLEKNETKRVLYGGLIVELNRLLCLLGGKGDNVTVTLTWPDPLPENTLDKANEIVAKQKTGLVSDETLTAELGYRYADEQPRLTAERAKKAAQQPAQPAQNPTTPMPSGQAPGAMDMQSKEQPQ